LWGKRKGEKRVPHRRRKEHVEARDLRTIIAF